MSTRAEDTWQSLLEAKKDDYVASLESFRRLLFDGRVRFGERHLANHLRPKFLTEREYADLVAVAEAVLEGIMLAKDRLFEDPDLMAMIALTDQERELVAVDPGYSHIAPCVRLDSFITDNGPQFVELNGECPAGPAYCQRLVDLLTTHPLFLEFAKARPWRSINTLEPLLETLLGCYREWGGKSVPRILITDYGHVPTVHEFELCRQYFSSRGYPTVVVDPRELVYDGEHLIAAGEPVDLVYRRVLVNEFIERYDEVKNLHLAVRDRKVCMVNPFRSKIVHKKSIFAVLTSDDRDAWMPASVARLIDRAVPWTRNVREGKTNLEGKTIDLVPWIAKNREELVLKPNDEYGGKGVTLGWECDQKAWEEKIQEALQTPWVVQRRLHLIAEQFPSMLRNLEPDKLFVDLDPYLYRGKMYGALARLGAGGLCNVTSGGGQTALIVS